MEVRFAGLPDREPWARVDWDSDPNWESAPRLTLSRSSCRVGIAKPAIAAGTLCPTRQAWISYRSGRCATGGTSRSGGCCCTSSRRLPATLATQTSSAKRSMARSASSEPGRESSIEDRLAAFAADRAGSVACCTSCQLGRIAREPWPGPSRRVLQPRRAAPVQIDAAQTEVWPGKGHPAPVTSTRTR